MTPEQQQRFDNLCNEIDLSIAQQECVEGIIENFIVSYKHEILKLITDEIAIAHTEGSKTSRLTSLYNKIS